MCARQTILISVAAYVVTSLWTARIATGAYEYVVTDLGTLSRPQSAAYAINGSGQIVGYFTTASADCHGAFYDGALTDLGTIATDSQSMAFAINDNGQVVAQSYNLGELQSHAMLWEGGTTTNLGHFAPRGINGSGMIVGHLTTYLNDLWVEHACQWNSGALTDLGTLGGRNSRAFAVDGAGRVVGQSFLIDDLTVRACLWQNGAPKDLGALDGAANSSANDINDNNQIVGWSATAAGSPHAFRVEVDASGIVLTRTDLGTLANTYSFAYGINTAGDIVGTSDSRAVLWRGGQIIDLNTRIPPGANWTLLRAHAINDSGLIVGEGLHIGFPHGYLLSPVACTKADMNADGAVDGRDVQGFVQAMVFGGTPQQICAGDVGQIPDGQVTDADVEGFAQCLLQPGGCP